MNDEHATQSEAYREMVVNIGNDHPEREWILTPYDTWEKNPAYVGPPGPHPESDYDNETPLGHQIEEGGEWIEEPHAYPDDPPDYPEESCEQDF